MHNNFTTSAARELRAIRAGIFDDPYSVIALVCRAIVAEIISRFLIQLENLNRTKKLLKSLTWKDVGIIISVVVFFNRIIIWLSISAAVLTFTLQGFALSYVGKT